jgi:hypothetical protein
VPDGGVAVPFLGRFHYSLVGECLVSIDRSIASWTKGSGKRGGCIEMYYLDLGDVIGRERW